MTDCVKRIRINVYVYIDEKFQGITERTKYMLIFGNGSLYKTFIISCFNFIIIFYMNVIF